jgi:hypothetical protein
LEVNGTSLFHPDTPKVYFGIYMANVNKWHHNVFLTVTLPSPVDKKLAQRKVIYRGVLPHSYRSLSAQVQGGGWF